METSVSNPASELRCLSCHKLLMKDGEIKCPRCKNMVKVGHDCLILPQENTYIINTADLLGRRLQELLSKWPAALQQEFIYALQLVKGQESAGEPGAGEVVKEKVKIRLLERPVQPGEQIVQDQADHNNIGVSLQHLAEALMRIGIEPDLEYLKTKPQYRRLAFDLILLLTGRSKTPKDRVPLVNVYNFMMEPSKTGLLEQPLKADNAGEAYLMAYWERNLGQFSYRIKGKKVWEFDDLDERRDAIIFLTKNKMPVLSKKILS